MFKAYKEIMKKLVLLTIGCAIAFTSCKKKAKEDPMDTLFKLDYSTQTIEQQKKTIEKEGVDFIQKLNTLPDEKSIGAISHLSELNPDINSGIFSNVLSVNSAAKRKDVKGVFIASTNTSGDKLSDSYGIYTWNFATKEWDMSPSTSKLEIKYPSSETQTTNNAVFSFYYLVSPIKSSDGGELPSTINSVLKIDGKEELKLTSTYTYKSNGTPTGADVNLMMGAFIFKANAGNNGTDLTSSFSFLKGTELLIGLNVNVNGNTNLDANSDGDIVKNANATFEIMNIKLAGQVDVKSIRAANEANADMPDSLSIKKQAEAWGKYSKFVAINKTNNVIMARAEFVPKSNEYCSSSWNGSAFVEECDKEYILEPRLIFKDDSKVSFDSFIDNGFSQLRKELETFGEKFK